MGQEVSSRNHDKPPLAPRKLHRENSASFNTPQCTLQRSYRSNLEKFSLYEIASMKQSFLTLSSLSPFNNTIDKDTFLHYFPLDGILAERLFAVFDKDQNNVIDCDEFLGGLALCLRGTLEEKYKLIFDMFNLDGSDFVTAAELKVVLESSVLAASRILHSGENDGCIEVNSHCISELVDDIVKEAINGCNQTNGKLSLNDFEEWVERHPYILDTIFNHSCIKDKFNLQDNDQEAYQVDGSMNIPLVNNDKKCQSQSWVYGADHEEKLISNARLAKASYLWSPVFPSMCTLPEARHQHSVCVYAGSLYVLAGRGGGSTRKDFWKFDLGLNTWFKMEPDRSGPSSLQEHSAVVYRGLMFVFGGEFMTSAEVPLWIFDFRRNRWNKFKGDKGPTNRRSHTAVVHQHSMYVFGGYVDLRGASNQMWVFRFDTRTWHEAVSSSNSEDPGPLYAHSAVVHNNGMWVFGGLNNLQPKNDLWRWDFGVEKWVRIRSRSTPPAMHGHSAVKVGDGMLVFGGETGGHLSNTLWRFHFESYSWHVIKPHGNICPPVRSCQALAVLSSFSCTKVTRPSTSHSAPPPTPFQPQPPEGLGPVLPQSQDRTLSSQFRAVSVESMYSRNSRPNLSNQQSGSVAKQRPMSSSSIVARWRQGLSTVSLENNIAAISDESIAYFATPADDTASCDTQTLIIEDEFTDSKSPKRTDLPGSVESPPKTRKEEISLSTSSGRKHVCHVNCISCLRGKASVDSLPDVEVPTVMRNPQALYKPHARTKVASSEHQGVIKSRGEPSAAVNDDCEVIENLSVVESSSYTEDRSTRDSMSQMKNRSIPYKRLETASPDARWDGDSTNRQWALRGPVYAGNAVQPVVGGNVEDMLSSPLSLIKDGICLFVIGGKGKETGDFQRKALDIWRCDISFGKQVQEQVHKVIVQSVRRSVHDDAREKDLLVMDLK